VTKTGKTCQKWTSQSPQAHSYTPELVPNFGKLSEWTIHFQSLNQIENQANKLNPYISGLGDHNYCRNPDGEPSVWCYTMDTETRWELCDITLCSEYKASTDHKLFQ